MPRRQQIPCHSGPGQCPLRSAEPWALELHRRLLRQRPSSKAYQNKLTGSASGDRQDPAPTGGVDGRAVATANPSTGRELPGIEMAVPGGPAPAPPIRIRLSVRRATEHEKSYLVASLLHCGVPDLPKVRLTTTAFSLLALSVLTKHHGKRIVVIRWHRCLRNQKQSRGGCRSSKDTSAQHITSGQEC